MFAIMREPTHEERNAPPEDEQNNNIPKRLTTEKLFNGSIGKFKNIQLKLHIDKDVPPVAQPERRIPFALRQKVQTVIDKLEADDIIEDVTSERLRRGSVN